MIMLNMCRVRDKVLLDELVLTDVQCVVAIVTRIFLCRGLGFMALKVLMLTQVLVAL